VHPGASLNFYLPDLVHPDPPLMTYINPEIWDAFINRLDRRRVTNALLSVAFGGLHSGVCKPGNNGRAAPRWRCSRGHEKTPSPPG